MDLGLRGKLAVVTGASKGIGRVIAATLAQEGCDLLVVARNEAALSAVAQSVADDTGVSVRPLVADVATKEGIDQITTAAGSPDILVNNAGAIPPGGLLQLDDAAWRDAWELKVFGYINLSRALYPALVRRRGVIVNVIGAAGERLDPTYLAGCTGNASLMAFTKAMGKQAARDGARVVGINPGPVATDRLEMLLRARARDAHGDENRWRELLAAMPFGRAGEPEEIAAAAAFLASPRSAYTNGIVLTIDGAPANG